MTKQETCDFMERIRLHYPNQFIVDKIKISAWYETLKNYNLKDLNEKLERHLQSEQFKDKAPSLEFLIKYITPSGYEEENHLIECKKCGKIFKNQKCYDDHLMKCIRIQTMIRDSNKYLGANFSKEEMFSLYRLSDEEIENMYGRYIDKMLSLEEGLSADRKRILRNCK